MQVTIPRDLSKGKQRHGNNNKWSNYFYGTSIGVHLNDLTSNCYAHNNIFAGKQTNKLSINEFKLDIRKDLTMKGRGNNIHPMISRSDDHVNMCFAQWFKLMLIFDLNLAFILFKKEREWLWREERAFLECALSCAKGSIQKDEREHLSHETIL